MGTRMSLLPAAQFCGEAPKLAAQHGAGRAAAMSSAFHAVCAGAPEARDKWDLLSEEEQTEIGTWSKPTDVTLPGGVLLEYAKAEKEIAVALDDWGYPTPADGPDAFTLGHLDFAWTVETKVDPGVFCDGGVFCVSPEKDGSCGGHAQTWLNVAYVGDIKKTVWSSSGPDSLQLHAYGMAYALFRGCQGYVTGIWVPTDGKWFWRTSVVWLDSDEGNRILARILAAAGNQGEANVGAHCTGCWNRTSCKEWIMPVIDRGTSELLRVGSAGTKPAPEDAVRAVLQMLAAEDVIKVFKENIREWVRRGEVEVKDPSTGLVWSPIEMPGKESVTVSDLRKGLGEEANKFIKRGKPFPQFRWLKEAR